MSKIASTSTMKHSFLIRYILFICIIGFICFLFFFRNIPIKGLFEGLVDLGDPSTNHNVNQPINTTYQCSNMCGPLSRCSITGEQCTSDVDCTGCQPKIQPQTDTKNTRGQNDAGKLTTEQTPTYSTLTTDIGTQATLYNKLKIPPTTYNKGLNTWRSSFDVGNTLFQKRYNPSSLNGPTFQANYPSRPSLTGEFTDTGPLPSNSYL